MERVNEGVSGGAVHDLRAQPEGEVEEKVVVVRERGANGSARAVEAVDGVRCEEPEGSVES